MYIYVFLNRKIFNSWEVPTHLSVHLNIDWGAKSDFTWVFTHQLNSVIIIKHPSENSNQATERHSCNSPLIALNHKKLSLKQDLKVHK